MVKKRRKGVAGMDLMIRVIDTNFVIKRDVNTQVNSRSDNGGGSSC